MDGRMVRQTDFSLTYINTEIFMAEGILVHCRQEGVKFLWLTKSLLSGALWALRLDGVRGESALCALAKTSIWFGKYLIAVRTPRSIFRNKAGELGTAHGVPVPHVQVRA